MKFSIYAAVAVLSGSALANTAPTGSLAPTDLCLQIEDNKSNFMNKRSTDGLATVNGLSLPKLVKGTKTNSNITFQQFNVTSNSTGICSSNSTPKLDGDFDSSATFNSSDYKYSSLAAAIACVVVVFML